jgi:hypothetical protein
LFFQGHVHALKSLFQAHLQARSVVTIFQVSGFRQRKSIQSNAKSRWQGWCNRLLREDLFQCNSVARERGAMATMRIPIELPQADRSEKQSGIKSSRSGLFACGKPVDRMRRTFGLCSVCGLNPVRAATAETLRRNEKTAVQGNPFGVPTVYRDPFLHGLRRCGEIFSYPDASSHSSRSFRGRDVGLIRSGRP